MKEVTLKKIMKGRTGPTTFTCVDGFEFTLRSIPPAGLYYTSAIESFASSYEYTTKIINKHGGLVQKNLVKGEPITEDWLVKHLQLAKWKKTQLTCADGTVYALKHVGKRDPHVVVYLGDGAYNTFYYRYAVDLINSHGGLAAVPRKPPTVSLSNLKSLKPCPKKWPNEDSYLLDHWIKEYENTTIVCEDGLTFEAWREPLDGSPRIDIYPHPRDKKPLPGLPQWDHDHHSCIRVEMFIAFIRSHGGLKEVFPTPLTDEQLAFREAIEAQKEREYQEAYEKIKEEDYWTRHHNATAKGETIGPDRKPVSKLQGVPSVTPKLQIYVQNEEDI